MRISDVNMDELISRYLNGQINTEEKQTVEEWIEEDGEHEACFLRHLNLWEAAHPVFRPEQVDEEKALLKVLYKTGIRECAMVSVEEVAKRRRTILRWCVGAAAAVVVLCISLMPGVLLKEAPQGLDSVAQVETDSVQPGGSRAILTLASGEQVILNKNSTQRIDAESGVVIHLEGGKIEYEGTTKGEATKEVFNDIYIPRGGEFYLVLDGGTKVWLNADTRLRYPVKFLGNERKVFLTGEAFFDVAKDEKHPFKVVSPLSEVTVLGTTFDICAYADSPEVLVTLVSGKVEMEAKETGQSVVLRPGEQGVLKYEGNGLSKHEVDVSLFCSWKDGILVVKQMRLEDILNRLSRWYDVDVVWTNESLKDLIFSGEIMKYSELREILDVIETTKGVHFKMDGRSVIVSK